MFNALTYVAQIKNCQTDGTDCFTTLPVVEANNESLQLILSIIFGVLAAIAVIIIVIQAIKFTLSSGEPQKAADARKAIIYALVGLAISLLAEVIVRVAVNRL